MSKTFLQKNFVYYIFYHQLTVCKCFAAVFITKITAKKFGFYHRKPHYSCADDREENGYAQGCGEDAAPPKFAYAPVLRLTNFAPA